jgi:serine phosphatase RsbU (regulator of sigma subunit)
MDARTVIDAALTAGTLGFGSISWTMAGRCRCERSAIAGLERALIDPLPILPSIGIARAVLSASPGASIGGDIADVSGKGVEAAAHAAFVKHTIRALAIESDGDPAVILAKLNAMYPRAVADREAFVALIVGVIDAQTGRVRYASAGHEPAFVRQRDGSLVLLAPTGPVVGASPYSSYGCDTVTLRPGDLLVWTSDGLTESRDGARRLLGIEGLADWVAAAPHDVRGVAEALVESLRRRSGEIAKDDVAVLAVAYERTLPPISERRTIPILRYDSFAARSRRGR